jgi:hypothetical protein
VACILGFVALSLFVGWIPLKLAMRHLKDFEA